MCKGKNEFCYYCNVYYNRDDGMCTTCNRKSMKSTSTIIKALVITVILAMNVYIFAQLNQ